MSLYQDKPQRRPLVNAVENFGVHKWPEFFQQANVYRNAGEMFHVASQFLLLEFPVVLMDIPLISNEFSRVIL
jgi:hypothetical protein